MIEQEVLSEAISADSIAAPDPSLQPPAGKAGTDQITDTPAPRWLRRLSRVLRRRHRADATEARESGSEVDEAGPSEDSTDDAPNPAKPDNPATLSDSTSAGGSDPDAADSGRRPGRWSRVISFGVIPLLALAVAIGAAYFKYRDDTAQAASNAATESVQAAKDSTIAMLSYSADTAQQTLTAARDRLTGQFRDSYTSMTNDVVIPGAKDKRITATATVPTAAVVSAAPGHAVVLVFVNQAITMADDAPTQSTSVVEVTLDEVQNHWLISGFEPK